MLQVDVNKIIPLTEARDSLNKIVDDVDDTDEMYVLTKNGTPTAVIVGVNHLEKLTNEKLPDSEKTEKEPEKPSDANASGFQSAPAAAMTTAADNSVAASDPADPATAPVPPSSASADQTEADSVQAASPADDLFNDFSDINQPLNQPGSASGGKSIFDDDDASNTAPAVAAEPASVQTPAEPLATKPAPAAPQAMTYDDFIAGPPQNKPAAEVADDAPPSQFQVPAVPDDAEPLTTQDTPTSDESADTPPVVNPAPDVNPIASTPPSHPNYTYGSSDQGAAASNAAANPQQPDL